MPFEVIYLTGAPASGKSTLCIALQAKVPQLAIYHYSALLVAHIRSSHSELANLTEDDLRTQSARLITPADIETVDELLIKTVEDTRKESHVIIDSHAVTKESYGYRVTPFSMAKLSALRPTMIAMLYAEAKEIVRRISQSSGGRPAVTGFQADFHIALQAQVAVSYGLQLGLPIHVFDATKSLDPVTEKLATMLRGTAERTVD